MAIAAHPTTQDDPAAAILECLNTIDSNGKDPYLAHKGHSNLSAIEIWQYGADDPQTDLTVQEIETVDLNQWADKLPPTKAVLHPVAGLKLLIGDVVTSDEGMPPQDVRNKMRDSIRYVTKSFNIPSIICAANDHNARFWRIPQSAKAGFEANECYYANLHEFAVAWTTNPQSQVTTGLLLFRTFSSRQARSKLLSNLDRVKDLIHQPLAFPFALAETAAYTHSNALNRLGWHISNVDNSIEAFYELHGVKGAVNLTGFSAGTTFRAAQITMSQRGLHASLELVRHFSQTKLRPTLPLTHHKLKTLEAESSAIGTGLRCVQQTLEALILSAETYQARMSNQLTLILSLFSQEDQSIGIDIAKVSKSIALESRRDSSSMKTLAVVTMVFLPGTFIATFFAMPLFDWQAPNGQVVDKRIWIYFLVAIPLTAFTCAVWWAWFTLKTRREQKENEDILGHSDKKRGMDIERGSVVGQSSRWSSGHLLRSFRPRASR
jgi:hypothetical protein